MQVLDTRARLRHVMSAVFGAELASIATSDSSETIAQWDSVTHLQLMLAIEDEFGVRFEADELASLQSVGMIEARLGADSAGG